MARHGVTNTLVCGALFLLPSATLAQNPKATLAQNPNSCSMFGKAQADLKDHQLYYSPRSNVWAPISSADLQSLPTRDYAFTYVIQDFTGSGRAGVIVIKEGRYLVSGSSRTQAKSVRMIRTDTIFTRTKKCPRPVADFAQNGESVSAESYDGYHDYGYQGSSDDMDRISRFHVAYETANGRCVDTDNATSDKTFPGFWRSNRSQFSFDDYVVDNGLGWQLSDAARSLVGRSYAANGKFAERQVQIRRYETAGQAPSCIQFTMSAGPNHFLSINDLENWTIGIRGLEARWGHLD
jgi:hypothetical protein